MIQSANRNNLGARYDIAQEIERRNITIKNDDDIRVPHELRQNAIAKHITQVARPTKSASPVSLPNLGDFLGRDIVPANAEAINEHYRFP